MRNSLSILALALALGAPLARAGDAEAQDLLKQAYGHWNDADPAEALRLAEQALGQNPTNRVLRVQILLFKGSLHQVKTGNLDEALGIYDGIIRSLINEKDEQLLQLKADAMVRKGTILYSERGATQEALQLYISSHQTFAKPSTADLASQLCYRLARDGTRPQNARDQFMKDALGLAQEAVDRVATEFQDPKKRASMLAKFKLQKAIVQRGGGDAAGSEATWNEIVKEDLTEFSLYQQAVLRALEGKAEDATGLLKQFMQTRPTAKTRNQLRKFIRSEPDFAGQLEREDWKELVTDEAEAGGPASRPGR